MDLENYFEWKFIKEDEFLTHHSACIQTYKADILVSVKQTIDTQKPSMDDIFTF